MAELTGYVTPNTLASVSVYDVEFTGTGTVSGTTFVKATPSNLPVGRRVRLMREIEGFCVAEVWSDPASGAYAFNRVRKDVAYSVISWDHVGTDRAVIADGVFAV